MSRYRISSILLSLMFVACLALPATAEVTLDLYLMDFTNLQVFFLEDLNISGQAPSSVVLSAEIDNKDGHPYENAHFVFSMSSSQMEILRGESNPFTLMEGPTYITNLNLTEEGSPYELKDYEISSDADDIEQKLLQTGYFPSDTYTLRLELHYVPGLEMVSDQVSVIITNPFDINLVSPFGTPASPALLSMTTPMFIWSSSATEFLLKVCEKTSEEMDPESVIQGRPHYETDPSAPLVGQSFPYPGSGVRPLEPGRTYYWQVISLVQTSSGLKEYPSEIGAFSIILHLDPEAEQVLQSLRSLQQIPGLDFGGILEELSGYQPTGTIRLNGVAITVEEFEQTVQKLLMGEYRTTAVYAE